MESSGYVHLAQYNCTVQLFDGLTLPKDVLKKTLLMIEDLYMLQKTLLNTTNCFRGILFDQVWTRKVLYVILVVGKIRFGQVQLHGNTRSDPKPK